MFVEMKIKKELAP